jgi:metal-responsive CopG/Arc/MetJ family transcriptional regulator
MMSFMRTVIDVPEEVIESLDRVSASERRSRASVIREVLTKYVENLTQPNLEAAFGIWSDQVKDGVDYQNDLRTEWDN